jgi:HK97 family phage portal protein
MSLLTRFLDGLMSGARSFTVANNMIEPVYYYDQTDTFGRTTDPASYLHTNNTVYACNRLRAQMLSSLTPRLYKVATSGKRTEVTSGDLYELLHKVNPYWTFRRLIEMTEMSLGVFDQGAFWVLERGQGRSGRVPREIWWVNPERMRVKAGKGYIDGFEYDPPGGGAPIHFDREEVVWFRYPNVMNEYRSLTPLKAGMIAADTSSAAMLSNAMLFKNGNQVSGIVSPKPGTQLTEEQGKQIEEAFSRRFRGADKAHRIAVLRYEAQLQSVSITPKDAEFLGTLGWGKEEIATAYGVPLDLIGGQRTYENVKAAELGLWLRTLIPEAQFIADELTEQLLPLFPGQADVIEFDTANVLVLQEAEREKWAIDKEQIERGVMTINGYLSEQGRDPLPWGDVWWAPMGLTPVKDGEKEEPPPMLPPSEIEVEEPPEAEPRMIAPGMTRALEYGSQEHRAFMERADRRQEPRAARIGKVTGDLMRRQKQSILAQLRSRSVKRDEADFVDEPFDLPRWIRTFSTELRPVLRDIIGEAGDEALDDLGIGTAFDVFDPNVINALERQVQRFAREVNETTWNALKESLGEGFEAGESVDKLADRVNDVMGDRIRSSAETIARTESNIAHSNADLLGWKQSGVVGGKRWLSALDDRTRESHVAAHGQIVGLDDDFNVGGNRGQGPGLIGVASEDIQCRCTMTAVLDIDMEDA